MNILEHRQKAEIFLTHASNGIDMFIELHDLIDIAPKQERELVDFAKKTGIIRLQFRSSKKPKILFETEKPYILLSDKKSGYRC